MKPNKKLSPRLYGLIGRPVAHSFSPSYFATKFAKLGLPHQYEAFHLNEINQLPSLLKEHPNLEGLNVTIPYKTTVIPFLDGVDAHAQAIGAVNTIVFKENKLVGYNTDYLGFKETLQGLKLKKGSRALILGTGGSSKAVAYACKLSGIETSYISTSNQGMLNYDDVDEHQLREHQLIINTTPLGMWPNTSSKPRLPYQFLDSENVLIDLVYNPRVTEFLHEGQKKGCAVQNGFFMLQTQAEASWKLWQND
ncbi:MAG: shikimate dehydrogenase [Bacteroidia bacterium]|jgi:shikimate dehydrogenase